MAPAGEPGGGKRCKGKDGADLIIRVPRGTIIRDQKTGQVMKDMSDSEPFVAAKGGNGGWGLPFLRADASRLAFCQAGSAGCRARHYP